MIMKAKISLSILALTLALSLSVACSKGTSDAQISSQVQAKVASDSNIQNKQITVESANGVVTLSGNVASDMERTSAANDAATVPGVKTVINNLQVQPQSAQAQVPATAATPVEPPRNESVGTRHRPAATPAPRTRSTASPSRAAASGPVDRTVVATPTASNAAPAPTVGPIETAAPAKPEPVTVPDGTEIAVRLVDPLDSGKNQAGDTFHATLAQPIMVGDQVAVPTGADVEGRVVEAKNAAHFTGGSSLTVELTRMSVNGKSYTLQTDQWSKQGNARGKNTAAKGGGGAAIGA